MKTLSRNSCCGGVQWVCSHWSGTCECEMTFGLFVPKQADLQEVPLLWYLSGLTCTHENAMTKAGAQIWAARHGIAVAFPDTSPRGKGVADDPEYDLGQGAGFYVNATESPWSANFRMWDYVACELPSLVTAEFPVNAAAQGITGHSMGGHGALTIAMTIPERFRSVSAFAPISNPAGSDWGRKQFTAYLGQDESAWRGHDATLLMAERGYPGEILIDQGADDIFLGLLRPEALKAAIEARKQPARHRTHDGYDHSYFFVMSFMAEHIAHHADILWNI